MVIIKSELRKLYYKKSTRILLFFYLITFLLSVLFYLGGESIGNLTLFNQMQYMGAGLSMMMNFLLPLVALYLASSVIALDYSSGTIKNMYLLPIRKEKIYIGKLIAVQGILGVLLIIQLMISMIVAMIQEGLLFEGFIGYIGEYVGAFFVLLLINLLGTALTLWLKSTGIVIITAYSAYIALGILTIYVPVLKSISLRYIISNYSELINSGNLFMLLSAFAYYIITFVCGLLLFEKKEEFLCQFD